MAEDQDILEVNFTKGDTKAFEAIYDKYFNGLYVFAFSLIQDTAASKDIVIELFNTLFLKHTHFHRLSDIKAFMYVSVRNRCLNYLKYMKRREDKKKELIYMLKIHSTRSFQVEGEILRQLNKSIEDLPLRGQQVIKLLFYEEMSYAEAAEHLSISPLTVKNHRKAAIEKLRKALKDKKILVMSLLILSLKIFY